jgi:hypothetical protein
MNDKAQDVACPTCNVIPRSKLRATLIGILLVVLGCSSLLLTQTTQDFTKIYDSYLAAVKNGSYSQVSTFLSAEMRDQIKTPELQAEYMEMMKQMAPIHYETEFVNVFKDGQTADVDLIVTVAVPEQVQKQQKLPPTQRGEMMLRFVKEAGQWKMGPPLLMGDPDKRARPKDLNMGSRADYAEGASTEVGGSILKMEKQSAGTVFLLRLPSEEIAVFVPAAKVSDQFVPGSILVVHGAENKTDKLKLWAEDAALYTEPDSK